MNISLVSSNNIFINYKTLFKHNILVWIPVFMNSKPYNIIIYHYCFFATKLTILGYDTPSISHNP